MRGPSPVQVQRASHKYSEASSHMPVTSAVASNGTEGKARPFFQSPHSWRSRAPGWHCEARTGQRQPRTTSPLPSPIWQQVSKCFRKGGSHRSLEQPWTVLLPGPGCRMGCVKRHCLNQRENSVSTWQGKGVSDDRILTLPWLTTVLDARPAEGGSCTRVKPCAGRTAAVPQLVPPRGRWHPQGPEQPQCPSSEGPSAPKGPQRPRGGTRF